MKISNFKLYILLPFILVTVIFNIKSVGKFIFKKTPYSISIKYTGSSQVPGLLKKIREKKDSIDIARYPHIHHRASGYGFLVGTVIDIIYDENVNIIFPANENDQRYLTKSYCLKPEWLSFFIHPRQLEIKNYKCRISKEHFEAMIQMSFYEIKTPLCRFYFLYSQENKSIAVYIYENNIVISP